MNGTVPGMRTIGDETDSNAIARMLKEFQPERFAEILEKLPLPQVKKLKSARKTLDELIYKISS